jgi:HSP90 family molecular chaperone
MAETPKKPNSVRRTSKAAVENSATGEAKPTKPVRKAKTAAAQPVAEVAPKTATAKSATSKAPAKKAVKKAIAKKAAESKATRAAAGKPVLVKNAEVLVMRAFKSAPVSEEQIARLAYRYWQERGCQHGHHDEDWARAEQELRQQIAKPFEKAS